MTKINPDTFMGEKENKDDAQGSVSVQKCIRETTRKFENLKIQKIRDLLAFKKL